MQMVLNMLFLSQLVFSGRWSDKALAAISFQHPASFYRLFWNLDLKHQLIVLLDWSATALLLWCYLLTYLPTIITSVDKMDTSHKSSAYHEELQIDTALTLLNNSHTIQVGSIMNLLQEGEGFRL